MPKLKAQMVLHNDTIAKLAEHLGISRQTLSGRINGHSAFRQNEIMSIALRYSLNSREITDIFF